MKRYFLVAQGKKGQTTVALFEALAAKLNERHRVTLELKSGPRLPLRSWLRKVVWLVSPNTTFLRNVAVCDVFVTQAPAAMSLHEIIVARLLGKRIVVFVLDVYPESITYMSRGDLTKRKRLFAAIENFLLDRVDAALVPSADFLSHPTLKRLRHAAEFTTWPSHSYALPVSKRGRSSSPLTIAFAGQINGIRDLPGAARRIVEVTRRPIELHVFSSDTFNTDTDRPLPERIKIIEHGFLPSQELAKRLNNLDAGLISLRPDFPLPAFPSKIFAYIDSGIPVLFHGPAENSVLKLVSDLGIGLSLDSPVHTPLDDTILLLKESLPAARQIFFDLTRLNWTNIDRFL